MGASWTLEGPQREAGELGVAGAVGMLLTVNQHDLGDVEGTRHAMSDQSTGATPPHPGERDVARERSGIEGLPEGEGRLPSGRGQGIETTDRRDDQSAPKAADSRADAGVRARQQAAAERAHDVVGIGRSQEAEGHVPAFASGPPNAALVMSGQRGQGIEHTGRWRHREEQPGHAPNLPGGAWPR